MGVKGDQGFRILFLQIFMVYSNLIVFRWNWCSWCNGYDNFYWFTYNINAFVNCKFNLLLKDCREKKDLLEKWECKEKKVYIYFYICCLSSNDFLNQIKVNVENEEWRATGIKLKNKNYVSKIPTVGIS